MDRGFWGGGFFAHCGKGTGGAALLLGLLPFLLTSAPSALATPAPQEQRAVLELFIDQADTGTILVIVRGKELLASVQDLERAGVKLPPAPRATIGGTDFVSLAQLAPLISYTFDEAQLVLRLTVNSQALTTNHVDLATSARPADLIYGQANSAFLNYAFGADSSHSVTGFTEQGINIDGALLDNGVSYDGAGLTRTSTALIYDDQKTLTQLTLGDAIVTGTALSGTADVLGIDYSKNFTINPYLTTYPLQTMAGSVTVPSTAYVYVNGQLVRTIPIQPGPFNLQNVPVAAGSSNTRVVLTNAFGQQQVLQAPYYFGTDQLRQGVSQFNFNLGVARAPNYSGLGDYQKPAGLAFYRYGVTNWLTLGGFAQWAAPALAGGADAALSLPYIGQIGLNGAVSRSGGVHGWAGGVQYAYQTAAFSLGGDYQLESNNYAALGLTPADDRTARRYDLSAGTRLFGLSIATTYTHIDDRDIGPQSQASLEFSRSIWRSFQLSLTLSQSRLSDAPVQDAALLMLTIPFGARSTASVAAQRTQGTWAQTEELQQSLPTDEGLGYSLQLQQNNSSVQNAQLAYQAPFGLYQFNALRAAGQTTETANLSGALVYIDGHVFPTRALQQSYLLADVPGVKGVTVDLYNNPIGTTDAQGRLLVPNLQPYYGNQVSIDPNTVPMNYDIHSTSLDIAPPYRGGAIVTFPVQRIQAVEGQVRVLAQGKAVGRAGDLFTIAAGQQAYSSPLGTDGAFYFENIPPGRYPADVLSADGTCHFTLTVPKTTSTVIKLGVLTCGS